MKRFAFFLFSAVTLCADSYRPDSPLPDCYPGIFNQPANVELCNGWFFAEGSFIYWRASQDYMDAARSGKFASGGATPGKEAHNFFPDFDYFPGFKVGIGAEDIFDHWSLLFEYTWLHQRTNHSTGPAPSSVTVGQKIWIPNDWFNTLSTSFPAAQAAQIQTHWKMLLDQFDLTVSLPFYEAPDAIIIHYGGLRSYWIRQKYNIKALLTAALTSPPAISKNESNSWSIGPMVGIGARSLFWSGFRFEGQTKFSLLYTRFTTLSHTENDQGFGSALAVSGNMGPYGAVRPASELGLGVGWGSYFSGEQIHIDVSARYDFNILWNMNMMRQTVGSLADSFVGYANAAGHLYLHGLTVDFCLNF